MDDKLHSVTRYKSFIIGELLYFVYKFLIWLSGLCVLHVVLDLLQHCFVDFIRLHILAPKYILIKLNVVKQLAFRLFLGCI